MSRAITLHPKHGVNPSLSLCFWCGEADGVVLLGRNGGKEAPRAMVYSYDPCKECASQMEAGVTLIEATHTPRKDIPEQPPIQAGAYPTGRWLVVKPEAIGRMFDATAAERVLAATKAYIEPAVMAAIMGEGS